MRFRRLIHPPRLWPGDGSNAGRRATWLELFFDLMFVAAVAQVGTPFHTDYSLPQLLRYAFLFLLIWWAWLGHTLYSTRFDTDDLIQRLFTLLQMFAVAVMAANAKDSLSTRSAAGFGAAYAAMRLVLVFQYLRARKIDRSQRLTTLYAIGFGIAAVLWIAAAFLDAPLRFWVWGAALAIDIGTPVFTTGHFEELPPDPEHLPERFGLFTIILLGESLVAVMRGIEGQEEWSGHASASAFLGMALIFAFWWWYYDGADAVRERHVRDRRQVHLLQVWSYAHLPMYLGIATVGIGIEHVIGLPRGMNLSPAESWILCGSTAVVMAGLTAIMTTSERAQHHPRLVAHLAQHYGLSAAAGVLGFFGPLLPPFAVVAILAGIAIVQVGLCMEESRHKEHPGVAAGDSPAA
jgi:low temperature requirement protein LtrA